MLLKLNPRHRMYDCPLTEVAHLRSTVEARLIEERERQREQREQEVRLILSTSRLANQPREMWPTTREALKIIDRVFMLFGVVMAGLVLYWMVMR